jgi:flavin-dependent dehydrogenase
MSDFDYDVAIVGAGLGGLSAAISLAQSGKKVVLFEGNAIGKHKVCGEFISPESRVIFSNLGVLEQLEAAGARAITSARILTNHRRGRTIPFTHSGIGISRAVSDTLLWNHAISLGVTCRDSTKVQEVNRIEGGFLLKTGESKHRVKFLIAATGRNGRHFGEKTRQSERKSGKYMGIKAHFRGVRMTDNQVQLFPYEGGYCGVVRVENDLVNACALIDYKRSRGKTPAQIWDSILEENSQLKKILGGREPEFNWLATGNVTFNCFNPATEDILRVGDAAGYIHPLTGDGMAMAVRSGELARDAIIDSPDATAASIRYKKLWHEEFDRRLRWGAWLQPLMTHRRWTLPALAFFDFAPQLMQKLVIVTRQK